MEKEIKLDELQALKFENLTLKQRLLEKEMSDLQNQQTNIVRELYPDFNGTHKCALNLKDKILTIIDESGNPAGSHDRLN